MRGDRYVLAIDMGSGSVKTALVSNGGELAGTGFHPVDTQLLPGGGAEHDPDQWWSAAMAAAKSALAAAAVPPERILAVVCTTQWAVTVPVDEGGHAIAKALSWMDTRGGRYSRAAADGWPKIEGYAVSKLLQWVRLTGAAPNHSGVDGFGHVLYFKHERSNSRLRSICSARIISKTCSCGIVENCASTSSCASQGVSMIRVQGQVFCKRFRGYFGLQSNRVNCSVNIPSL